MTASGTLAAALDDVATFIHRYIALRETQVVAIVLWVAHTYLYDRASQSPILAVTSAEPRSGKSRLLDVIEYLVARPWRCVRPSEAVLFRMIARDHPTVLVDEGDTLWADRSGTFEGLRAIFNAGNRRGSPIARVVGKEMRLVDFDTYCPKAIAGIGGLPATVVDRSIVIGMLRRRPDEPIERLRERTARAAAAPVRDALAAAIDGVADVTIADEASFPDILHDRARDGWEVLFAIADAAGPDWSRRARAASVELATDQDDAAEDGESLPIRLLRDLQEIFHDDDADGIPTAVLIERLAAIEDAPWSAIPPRDKALTPDRMRRLLRRYRIRPTKFRPTPGGPQVRGYLRASMTDAWERYLWTSPQASQPSQASHPSESVRAGLPIAETPETPGTPAVGTRHNGTTTVPEVPCAVCGAAPVGVYLDGSPRFVCGPHPVLYPA